LDPRSKFLAHKPTQCEQANLPDEFDENLTKAEASEKIEEIRALLGK